MAKNLKPLDQIVAAMGWLDMTNEPTNGWTRAEMLDFLMAQFHEATSAMAYMPDMNGSALHQDMVRQLAAMRDEWRGLTRAA
jgi:hypothetical protein